MDQSKSSDAHAGPPPRKLSLEFWVGMFTLAGVAACAYLAVGLGGVKLTGSSRYNVFAEFDNVSGLQYGASVEIAGVPIGEVAAIQLKGAMAVVTLSIDNLVKLHDDDIASIRTKGIIGDRYVKVSPGGSSTFIPANGRLTETESVVDIEDIIGKVVHSLGGDKDEEKGSESPEPVQ